MNKEEVEKAFGKFLKYELEEKTSNKIERISLYLLESGVVLYIYCCKYPLNRSEKQKIVDIASEELNISLLSTCGNAKKDGYIRFTFDYNECM